MGQACVSNPSGRPCNHLQGGTAGPREDFIKAGCAKCWEEVQGKKCLRVKKALTSVALAVQQYKNEVPSKKTIMVKKVGEMKTLEKAIAKSVVQ